MAPIVPMLEIAPSAAATVVEARVQASPALPLTWRLVVETRAGGNRSRIVQSGATDGRNIAPLATVGVNNPGEAELQVYSAGQLVAHTRRDFAPAGG